DYQDGRGHRRSSLPSHAVGAEPRARGQLRSLLPDWELHDEPAAARKVVARPDEPVVVRHDGRDDRQAEARALGLGREVRLEQPRLHLGGHAVAVVGDLETDDAEAGDVRRLALEAPALAPRDG